VKGIDVEKPEMVKNIGEKRETNPLGGVGENGGKIENIGRLGPWAKYMEESTHS